MCSYNHDSKNYSIHIQFWWKNTLYTLHHDKKLLYATKIMIKNDSSQLQSWWKITLYSYNHALIKKLLHTATILMKNYSIQLQSWWKITPYSYNIDERLLHTATVLQKIYSQLQSWWILLLDGQKRKLLGRIENWDYIESSSGSNRGQQRNGPIIQDVTSVKYNEENEMFSKIK